MNGQARSRLKAWQPTIIWLTYGLGLLPAVWYFYRGATGDLGADPVKTFELFLGLWALRFLILTLAITPLRELAGWNLIAYRRALGLLCFYYAVFHFTVYLVLDQALDFGALADDILKRPFILFGMATLLLLIPLAATSNRASIRRLGKTWILLHRLIYIAAATTVLHYALSTKVLSFEQWIYITLIMALLLYRSLRPILRTRRTPVRRGETVANRPERAR